jgi:hypothetical protein
MAKEQGLPLNPSKISGVCGRLLCCLSYENENYIQAKQSMPQVGAILNTPSGPGKVVSVNVPQESVEVMLESGVTIQIPVNQSSQSQGPVAQLAEQRIGMESKGGCGSCSLNKSGGSGGGCGKGGGCGSGGCGSGSCGTKGGGGCGSGSCGTKGGGGCSTCGVKRNL